MAVTICASFQSRICFRYFLRTLNHSVNSYIFANLHIAETPWFTYAREFSCFLHFLFVHFLISFVSVPNRDYICILWNDFWAYICIYPNSIIKVLMQSWSLCEQDWKSFQSYVVVNFIDNNDDNFGISKWLLCIWQSIMTVLIIPNHLNHLWA